LLPGHPFDLLYRFGVQPLTSGPPIPPNPLPRRFACLLATVMIVTAAWSFQSGRTLSGQILGWALVGAAFVNVSTGFCIPSLVYGLIFGKPAACNLKYKTMVERNKKAVSGTISRRGGGPITRFSLLLSPFVTRGGN
jgi:hypothetical protein